MIALAAAIVPAVAGPPGADLATHGAQPPLVTPVAVFGEDERTAVPPRLAWVAERIGLLFNNTLRTVCTAFCVADNLIVTAAHCVARGESRHVRFSDFRFGRNYDRSRELVQIEGAATGAAAQHVLTGDFRLKVRPPIDAAFDWALVRVPRNTCPTKSLELRPMSSADIIAEAKAGHVFQISYHRDVSPWKSLYSRPCAVSRDFDTVKWSAIAPDFIAAEQMLLHTCDTGGASSGSPLLVETAAGAVVVGLNVGTYVQSRIVTHKGLPAVKQQAETVANTAVNVAAFAARIEQFRAAQIIATSVGIRDLQDRLRLQNLYTGRIDGSYGPQLRTAIEAYEQASRLPVTGLPTVALVQRLAQDSQRSGQVAPSTGETRDGR